MILSEEKASLLLGKAWAAYRYVNQGITNLENIGLSVDGAGGGHDKNSMSVLFGAVTALTDAIEVLSGIQPGSVRAEEADMLIPGLADDSWPPEKPPAKLISSLADVADTGRKEAAVPLPENAKPFEVTVQMTGGVTVYAKDGQSAMEAVNAMGTSDILEQAAWDYPVPTDVHE